jgi:lysophospholipase L1-like esterase
MKHRFLRFTVGPKLACAMFALACLPAAQAASPATPETMVALGDSLTAGVLAPYGRKQAMLPTKHLRMLFDSLGFLFGGDRESFAFRRLSWSTGEHDWSHAARLHLLNPRLRTANLSEPSAFTRDLLEEQLPALEEWSQRENGGHAPDYATLLIGHNDLCAPTLDQTTPPESYRRMIRSVLSRVLEREPGRTRLLVLPLAPLYRLRETSARARVIPVWPGLSRCEKVWETIPLCPSVTQARTPAERDALRLRVEAYNGALSREVGRARARHGDRVRLATGLSRLEVHPDLLAIDCFHPNKKAQELIAQLSWEQSWWAP